MKVSTFLLACLCFLFCSTISAKSTLPTFFEPINTFYETKIPATEECNVANKVELDTAAGHLVNIFPTLDVFPDLCGNGIGQIDLTPDPCCGPYTYEWSNGETTQDLMNLTPDTYTVTITDINGTKATGSTMVGSLPPIAPLTITAVTTGNSLCNGMANGAIDLSVTPPSTWTYEWSNGATTMDITNLPPGTYTVSVTYGVTCTTTAEFTVLNLTNAPTLIPPIGGFGLDFCGTGSGTAAIQAIGGVPPYTYTWSNGATTLSINNLDAGDYTVTVSGSNGCSETYEGPVNAGTLAVMVDLNLMVNNTICIGGNGSLNIDVSPPAALATATYAWSNGATTQDITNLTGGYYTVIVTRLGSCADTIDFLLSDIPNLPTISLFPVNATCGMSNGSVNLNHNSGGPPGANTYIWSSGQTTQSLTNVPPGDYVVTVTASNGCTITGSATVQDVPIVFSVFGTVTDQTSCDTILNGKVVLTISPSNLPFMWSNGATTKTIKNLVPGDYTVTVTAGGTCITIETYTVSDLRDFPNIPAVPSPSYCGLPNGSINMTITGGQSPFTVLWSTGDTSQDVSHLLADTFFVTVTNSAGCTSRNAAIVKNLNPAINILGNATDNISCAIPTGSVFLDVVTSDSSLLTIWSDTLLTYNWSSGQTTDSLFNLTGGDYLVTVTYGLSCIDMDTFAVANTAFPPNLSASATSTNCDFSNGAVNLNVSAGAGPFTYLWSNAATTEDLVNLPPGIYSVTVTGINGCTAVIASTVLNNNIALSVSGAPVENTSCAASNGALDISVSPVGVYNYLWSNTATSEDLNNLPAGTYTVTVSLGTCLTSNTFSIADNALPPNLSISGSPASCDFSNGAADLNVSGGTSPLSFIWSNAATTEDLTALPPGSYSVTVTGGNSCTAESSVTVLNNNIAISVNGTPVENTSCAASNGALDISVIPVGVYNYLWSNTATSEDLNNLPAGTYTVTVSIGTCFSTNSFSLIDNALPPNLSTSGSPASCDFSNGAADLNVSGGTGPFSFIWSNMATSEDLTALPPGSYSVTVTGGNSCTAVSSVTVLNNNIALNLNATPLGNSSCTISNGSLDLSVVPAGTYNYIWSNTATTEDLSNLNSGIYTVTVSLGTCQSANTFVVADNTSTPVLGTNITASICSVNNGAIDLNVSGPAGPYVYEWSNMATTQDIGSLLPGNYSVTVTASNGCTDLATYNVPNNATTFSLAAASIPLTDCVANNGAINLNITPAGAYTYLWSNAATTEDLSALPPGTYTVSVTESGSCTATASYFVMDQRTSPIASQSVAPEVCGLANGSIDLGVSGGTGPFGYQWTSGQISQDLTNIAAGTYTVTVTDVNNCSATVSATVPGNTIPFALAGTPSANSSCIQNNGAIDLSVNPAPPGYTFAWSSGQNSEDLSNLPSGTYTVTVSAGGNCINTAVFTVASNVPTPLLTQSITAAFCGQAIGSIDLSVSGSPAPYQYFWSNAVTNQDLTSIISGTYSVTVTAANGCTTVDNFVVPENSFSPAIGSVLSPASSCIVNNGVIDLTITPPAPGYSFTWSNGVNTEDQSNLAAGTYTVTVSAGGACSSTAAVVIVSNLPLPALSNNIAAATCGQASGSIDLSVTGSPAPYQYFWSNAVTNQDLNAVLSGNYTVTVTAANGCTSVGDFTIPETVIIPQISGTPTTVTSCVVNNGAINLTVGPATGYLFNWSNAATTEDLLNIAVGTYNVTVNGGGACTNTASFVVTSNAPPPALSNIISAASCAQASGSINLSVATGPAPYIYNWSNNATTEDLANILSGAFTVTVTAANGCTSVGNFTVPENVILPVISGVPTADNSCVAINGAINLTVGPATGYLFSWSNAAITEDLMNIPAGSYTVTVNGGGACTGTASFVVADQTTQPVASINSANLVLDCSITTTTLNGNVTGTPNPSSFQWLQNGTPLATGNNLVVNAPGLYNLIVQDNVTFCTATASITVTQNLNPPALLVATPGVLTCITTAQTLSGSSTVGGVQFGWATIIGTDTTIIGNGPTHPVSTPGIYYLIGVNPANNCANVISVNVTADQTPPTADAGTPFTLDCAGETAPLNGSGTGAANLSYFWSTQNGHFASNPASQTPLIDKAGTYVLSVTNAANGCVDIDQIIIVPETPVAYASVIQPTCQQTTGAIQVDSVTGLSGNILYSLNNSQPSVQDEFTDLVPGSYTIQALGNAGCNASTTVTVNFPTQVAVTLTPSAEIAQGYSYQIDATVNIPNSEIASVTWTPSTGLLCDTCLNTTATPFYTQYYQVLVVSTAGCEARGNLTLLVDRNHKVYGPNIFSPDDDGKDDVFTIFADPFTVVKIKSLQIFSRWGEEVFELLDFTAGDTNLGWDGTLHGEKLNPAVFVWQAVVEFVDGKEEVFFGDVMLQR